MIFYDRVDAGRQLASKLAPELARAGTDDVVVLGLPRGGVPVAYEVARALDAPLDVIVVRKVGVPWQPELAMGAVGEDGTMIVNPAVVRGARVEAHELTGAADVARAELGERIGRLRGDHPRIGLHDRTAVIVDDGIATGATARVACEVARAQGAARVVLAVPVAPPTAVTAMSDVADDVVCVQQPEQFHAVGQFYEDFTATSDADVMTLLDRAATAHDRAAQERAAQERALHDQTAGREREGDRRWPPRPPGRSSPA